MSETLRDTLSLLGLEGHRFALAAARTGRFEPDVFDDVESAERWLAEHEDWDLYITGNPIQDGVTGRPGAADVAEVRWLLVDVDPERTPDDPEGVDPAKRQAAADVAHKIARLTGGAIVDSGRGTQVWVRHVEGLDRKAAIQWLRSEFEVPGTKIDATQDPSRLMRLPGSVNSRTRERVEVVGGPTGTWSGAEVRPVDVGADPTMPACWDEPTPEDRRWLQGRALELWDEPSRLDRSKRDAVFVLELLRAGCPETSVSRLLYALPEGKANTDRRGEGYWASTVRWARAQLAREERLRALADGLPERLEDDAGAAFTPEALEALAFVKQGDLAEWQRLRSRIKKTRAVKMKDLEDAIREAENGDAEPPDEVVRMGVAEGEKQGYWVKAKTSGPKTWGRSGWNRVGYSEASAVLKSVGYDMRAVIESPWTIVAEPFQPEMLEGRRWNLSKARLKVEPRAGEHPTWDQLLRVVGRGLDDAVQRDAWCREHGLETGADYLRAWLASMFQRPKVPTAYLFVYGPENCGKSLFHEALGEHLLDGGYMPADDALISSGGFSGELMGAVLCYVEETDLGVRRSSALNRLKAWVTGPRLKIHPKGRQIFTVANTTHWIQTANKPGYCPIFPGDTRITAWRMEPPRDDERVSKGEMNRRMAAEAPTFMATLLGVELPQASDGRLGVPALATAEKGHQQEASKTELEVWLEEHPRWIELGDRELVERFHAEGLQTPSDARHWTRGRILRELPDDGLRLRQAVVRLRQLGEWRGTPAELGEVLGLGSRQGGRFVAEVIRRGVDWVERGKSKGNKVIRVRGVE